MSHILGINAYHGDAAACLLKQGMLVAGAEEERFRRVKHCAGFPSLAIHYCLQEARLKLQDIDHIAINRDPKANFLKRVLFSFSKRPALKAVKDRWGNMSRLTNMRSVLAANFGIKEASIKAKIWNVEHHRAHLASAFFVSRFKSAALVSVDGFGDFVSAMWGIGNENKIQVFDQINFPHSLGIFYSAMTQYLGFPHYGDEYKIMGLAAYGKPTKMRVMRQIVSLLSRGRFSLDLDYFLHHSQGVSMLWEHGEPQIGRLFSNKLERALGPARTPEEPITSYHEDVAASAQAMYEEALFHLLNRVYLDTKSSALCLAGGCAMNAVANGKISEKTPFKDMYVQAAAGDAGGAIGAAFYVWNHELQNRRSFVMDHTYWGPAFRE